MPPQVRAVSVSPAHGFSKTPQPRIRLIQNEGVEGDAHRGRTVQHLYRVRQDPTQPNLAQVHLFPEELLAELAPKGHTVHPGEIGENILTAGLDLLNLPLHTQLRIGETLLEVSGLRTPCSQIDRFQPGLQQHLWGPRDAQGRKTRRAGIMAVVLQGGEIRPGDPIEVTLPPPPHHPLPPV